jgi:flagellar hook assembly protein FlgD
VATDSDADPTTAAREFTLQANEPNPFRSMTTIRFSLPSPSHVALAVFDPAGHRVRTLVGTERPAGLHSVIWDGTNAHGKRMPAGVYFYRLSAGSFKDQGRMVLLD